MSHCDLQHFSESFLQEPQSNEPHPAFIEAMAIATATAIRFTFMVYLTFFCNVFPVKLFSGQDGVNITPISFRGQWGIFKDGISPVCRVEARDYGIILCSIEEKIERL
jgi:hypothetical protein